MSLSPCVDSAAEEDLSGIQASRRIFKLPSSQHLRQCCSTFLVLSSRKDKDHRICRHVALGQQQRTTSLAPDGSGDNGIGHMIWYRLAVDDLCLGSQLQRRRYALAASL